MEGPVPSQDYVLPASAGIGHVHLRVSDLEASIAFYRDVLGFRVMTRFGNEAAFLSAGGYHHHLGLNTWESARGPKPRRDATGLYHFALRFPDRRTLGLAVRRVLDAGVRLQGAADHGVSQSVYLSDPDGIGVELTVDTPRDSWRFRPGGDLDMVTEPLDLRALLEAGIAGEGTKPD